ncbi:MAG: TetR family transcriptional regulator, partial [Anaerolineales bacterium]|nr:TetR family transcriptional regulator [Anaerolineales bacterium]
MAQTLTRTQRRQRATKERIFRVAMDLFITKGFENTTVSEITEAADIGKGTFFTYFPTKEAIFRQLGAMMMETMSTTAEEGLSQNQPISLVLKNTLLASVDWHEANKPITQQVVRSHFSMDAETSNKNRLVEMLASLVRTGQSHGEFTSEFEAW